MTKLLVIEGGRERTVEIATPVIEIGRAPENAVAIADPRSSRKHCRLSRTPQGWVLEDLKSRNGTTLNGTAVDKKFIQAGDEFHIGQTRFRLIEEPDASPRPPERAAPPPAAAHAPSSTAPPSAPPPPGPAAGDDILIMPSADEGPADRRETAVIPAPAAAATSEDVFLEGVEGPHAGRKIRAERFPFTIGRKKGNDVVLQDPKVSGSHVRLVRTGEGVRLEDLESRNGTLVDGRKVRETKLRHGSTVRIGDSSFRIELPPAWREEGLVPETGAPEDLPAPVGGPAADGHPIAEDDFTRFNAREFLSETGRAGSPLSVAAVLLVLGTILFFAVDITLKFFIPQPDPDPPEAGNLVANWSFEEPAEGGGVPGWAADEATGSSISLSPENAQLGRNALRLQPAGPGLARAVSLREIPVDPSGRYRLTAHVKNLGGFAAGVAIDWLVESGGGRVEVGRDWGSSLWEEIKGEDLDRVVQPPPSAVLARISPFVFSAGAAAAGAAFDRISFTPAEADDRTGGEDPEAGGAEEAEADPDLFVEVEAGGRDAASGPSPGSPILVEVWSDGVLRNLRRGSRSLVQSLWVGLSTAEDPLAIGVRLLPRPRDDGVRDEALLTAQLPDTEKGDWFPLEERVRSQGNEVQSEFRFGRGRAKEGGGPAERCAFYMEAVPAVKEVMAFGGSLKAPVTFPPDRPEAVGGPVEEVIFGTGAEQVAVIFTPAVTLKAVAPGGMGGRKVLAAEAAVVPDAQARTSILTVRFSPFSRREDEAAAGLLDAAEKAHQGGKAAEARKLLEDLRTRFPWRAADLARAVDLEKGWSAEAERALKDLQTKYEDLLASPSPIIRGALMDLAAGLAERFQGTPSQEGFKEVADRVRKMAPADARAKESPPLLQEARTHLDRGEFGLADLCIQLARAADLQAADETEAGHLEKLIAEKLKQKSIEEVR